MKRILAATCALLLVLTGCGSARGQSDGIVVHQVRAIANSFAR